MITSMVRDGEHTFRYNNGQLLTHSFLRNGKLDGKHKEWHRNGRPMAQEFYQNGILDGESKVWNLDGTMASHYYYRNGEIVDRNFTLGKKVAILRAKRWLFSQCFKSFDNPYIIYDLLKVVCAYSSISSRSSGYSR